MSNDTEIIRLDFFLIQDDRMASNDDGIEWQANTFDAVLGTNMYRILMIFASF